MQLELLGQCLSLLHTSLYPNVPASLVYGPACPGPVMASPTSVVLVFCSVKERP
jgi:hypothetical protein